MDKTRDAAETRSEPRQPVATAARAVKSGAALPAAASAQTQSTQFTDWAAI